MQSGGAAAPTQPSQSDTRTPHLGLRQLPWFALLTGTAMLLNTMPLPLFFGIQLLLGSVAPILALLLWRSWWAVGMGVLASLLTWQLWGHPWAMVIFSLELVWLCLGLRRFNGPPRQDGNGRVVLLAIAYWLLLGIPLVVLFYGRVLGIDPANVTVVAVKQGFNGVFNAVLAFAGLILVRAIQARRGSGPGLSLRGVIMSLILMAITLPTLLIGISAGQQLEQAVQRGALDGLRTVNLAVSRAGASDATKRLLIEQLGGDLAYRRIEANGRTGSSDPALFERLDGTFSDGGRTHVPIRDLAILIPRGPMPTLRKWVNGYWSYSQQYAGDPAAAGDASYLVQVVQPARPMVIRLQEQSAALLAVTFTVLVLGALVGDWLGRRFEREFTLMLAPLENTSNQLQPLRLSPVSELRSMALLINHRIRQVNLLAERLRQANAGLRESQLELRELLTCDPLTGCGNRKALSQRLSEEWHRSRRSGEPLACLCFDVDDFTGLNRRWGRQAGDALLQGLASAARKRLRVTDHFFRSGADAFTLLASGCGPEDAQELALTLQAVMSALTLTPAGDHPGRATARAGKAITVSISVSVGATCLSPQHDSAAGLLLRAKQALNEARARGRGSLLYLPAPTGTPEPAV